MEYAKAMTQVLEREGLPLENDKDLDPLMEVRAVSGRDRCWLDGVLICRRNCTLFVRQAIGDKRFVLLGEASHGTHEYYSACTQAFCAVVSLEVDADLLLFTHTCTAWRARISKRLIQEKGFNFIAMEGACMCVLRLLEGRSYCGIHRSNPRPTGDWPDCFEINKYIKGFRDAAKNPAQIVKHFKRWPTFMLGNLEIAALATSLRKINDKRAPEDKYVCFQYRFFLRTRPSADPHFHTNHEKGRLLRAGRVLPPRVAGEHPGLHQAGGRGGGHPHRGTHPGVWLVDGWIYDGSVIDGRPPYNKQERALHCFEQVAVSGKEDVGQSYGMAATLTPYSCREEVVDLLVKVCTNMKTSQSLARGRRRRPRRN